MHVGFTPLIITFPHHMCDIVQRMCLLARVLYIDKWLRCDNWPRCHDLDDTAENAYLTLHA